jgi:putative membrane protein
MVPYDQWMMDAFNWSPNETFDWHRNHYDRWVHFMFGLCIFFACYDWFKLKLPSTTGRKLVLLVSWLSIQTFSLIYELFEWGLTFALSPEAVESYNGQQGDMWDPHKDMALALLGATISACFIYLQKKKSSNGAL